MSQHKEGGHTPLDLTEPAPAAGEPAAPVEQKQAVPLPPASRPGIWPPPATNFPTPGPASPVAPATPVAPVAPVAPNGNRKHLVFGSVGLGVGLLMGLALGQINLPFSSGAISSAAEACNVVDTPGIYVGDNGKSISMSSEGNESAGAEYADIYCVLGELEIPDSVDSRIGSTRALDGRQSADWKEFTASWGYHPDSGLNIVVEISDR